MGDPAGIGPEVVLKAATVNDVRAEVDLVVYGDPVILRRSARHSTIKIDVEEIDSPEAALALRSNSKLGVIPITGLTEQALDWGKPTPAADRAQIEYVRAAFEATARGQVAGLVTGPINKQGLGRAGIKWPGHTEMLAELSGVEHPVMMLAGPTLKVVPLTTHVALKDVSALLSERKILSAIRIADEALRRHFGRSKPRIAVAGLNPHAGEGGLFGDEEQQQIKPAILAAQEAQILASGPFPGDTIFHRAAAGEFDLVIGMYHDQALIPIKLLDFDRAVNVTLGLPIIRTSVDHGTAYDIAGRGVASAKSMIEAIRMAGRMARQAAESSHGSDQAARAG